MTILNSPFVERIHQNHSYHDQILRKANWIKDNIATITIAIKEVFGLDDDICIERILPTIATYTPAFSSYLLNDINCVAITELLNSVQRRELANYREI